MSPDRPLDGSLDEYLENALACLAFVGEQPARTGEEPAEAGPPTGTQLLSPAQLDAVSRAMSFVETARAEWKRTTQDWDRREQQLARDEMHQAVTRSEREVFAAEIQHLAHAVL
eukprot:4902150-Prymnesium_polylepis.1